MYFSKSLDFFNAQKNFLIILFLCFAVSLLIVLNAWSGFYVFSSFNSYSTLGGLIPHSDALMYYWGAENILNGGLLDSWNLRRPINALFLSVRLWMTGDSYIGALLIQTALFSFCLSLVIYEFIRTISWVSVVFFGAFFLGIGFFVLYTPLSESLGMSLGLLAFLLLWTGQRDQNIFLFSFGMFLLTAALNARSGAFFVLPMIFLWILFQDFTFKKKWVFGALTGVLGAFFYNKLLLWLYSDHSTLANLHSNFSYIIYGLAAGGKGWQHSYTIPGIHSLSEAEQAKLVYQETIKLIMNSPVDLIKGLIKNFVIFVRTHLYPFESIAPNISFLELFTLPKNLSWIKAIFSMLILSSGFFIIKRFLAYLRNYPQSGWFVFCAVLGNIFSVFVIWVDGKWRVFSATMVFFPALLSLAFAKIPLKMNTSEHNAIPITKIAVGLSCLMLLSTAFLPKIFFKANSIENIKSSFKCQKDEQLIIAHSLHKAPHVNLSNDYHHSFLWKVSPTRFKFLTSKITEVDFTFPARNAPSSFGLVFDMLSKSLFYVTGPLNTFDQMDNFVGLCVQPLSSNPQIMTIHSQMSLKNIHS
ncbi:hypothetical protein GQ61_03650 [Candidatus Nucleicultrix amoebiphila FS5]|jgi:hypothetical protein|uniref:Glycosyltransferase RgtA/B/C/D-like domain-containing protein n=1 Tax=Candidatus Nucleicultrix amoebiphila FS5 TaxID=1414854 RepID=A0A1W6N3U4_9PROT|nr:hypothetical protein GQ61_03650 [Candidatus Nucleicultrix amoebiphila FS5]